MRNFPAAEFWSSPFLSDLARNQVVGNVTTPPAFRGAPVPASGAILEILPLGELFYAHGDRSSIIHEPRDGRMPPFQAPPGTLTIVAAIWL